MSPEQPNVEQLGQSYGALLEQQNWTSDPVEVTGSSPADPEPLATPPPAERILEALLFAGGEPLSAQRACEIVRGMTLEQCRQGIDALNRAYRRQGRPYLILAAEDGYILTLRPAFRGVVEKLFGGIREARLSQAAIDVLSLLAYRQPATKAEIDALRGAESGALLRQLVRRGLAAILHRPDATQSEVAYGTTPRFLQLFNLTSLDDLPRTQDLQQI